MIVMFFAWVPEHAGIWRNTIVDLAVKYALEKPAISTITNNRLAVSYSDFMVLPGTNYMIT